MCRRSPHLELFKPFTLYYALMFSVSILLGACDSRIEWQDGAYQLRWIDTPELSLVYANSKGQITTLIDADVIGIGSDQKHIIVRQRHHHSREISYFIINKQATNLGQHAQVKSLQHMSEEDYRSHAARASWPSISQEFHYP